MNNGLTKEGYGDLQKLADLGNEAETLRRENSALRAELKKALKELRGIPGRSGKPCQGQDEGYQSGEGESLREGVGGEAMTLKTYEEFQAIWAQLTPPERKKVQLKCEYEHMGRWAVLRDWPGLVPERLRKGVKP